MTLSIPLSPLAEEHYRRRAELAGVDLTTQVADELERAALARSFDAISRPIAAAFEATGMSEDELVAFLEDEKHAARIARCDEGARR